MSDDAKKEAEAKAKKEAEAKAKKEAKKKPEIDMGEYAGKKIKINKHITERILSSKKVPGRGKDCIDIATEAGSTFFIEREELESKIKG